MTEIQQWLRLLASIKGKLGEPVGHKLAEGSVPVDHRSADSEEMSPRGHADTRRVSAAPAQLWLLHGQHSLRAEQKVQLWQFWCFRKECFFSVASGLKCQPALAGKEKGRGALAQRGVQQCALSCRGSIQWANTAACCARRSSALRVGSSTTSSRLTRR